MVSQSPSFNWFYLILIPAVVSGVVSVLTNYISHHILKKSVRKESVNVAVETEKVKKTSDVLSLLVKFVDRIEKLSKNYVPLVIEHLEQKATNVFETQIQEGLKTFGTIQDFCKTNDFVIEDMLKTKITSLITIFKDDIVFVMKNMKNFDRERKKDICKKYLNQIDQAYDKIKESIKDIRNEIKSRLEI